MSRSQDVIVFDGLSFDRPIALWGGIALVTAGVVAHIPMYLMGRHNGYQLVGMPMDPYMIAGMYGILVGFGLCLYGLYPKQSGVTLRHSIQAADFAAFDDAKINRAHLALLFAMAIAVTIDVMKPTSLSFVMPGMSLEYDLKSPLNPTGTMPVALVALSGILGTVVGAFVWGELGDKLGRRATVLMAGIIFIGTSICGAMPSFYWNLVMCFAMGVGVGGMLPVCYTLLAEIIPARHRGWIMILIGADIAGAYILTSWLSAVLVPTYSWRILWLIGLPTGVPFLLLSRWIPESPRFLFERGRDEEALAVMARFCVVATQKSVRPVLAPLMSTRPRTTHLNPPFIGLNVAIWCLAISAGLVLFGFTLWIPTNLRQLGFDKADMILRNAALAGLPLTLLVAWLYRSWSTKKTLLVLTTVTAVALYTFVIFGDAVVQFKWLLYILLASLIWGINALNAVLAVYSSEIFRTSTRSRNVGSVSGLAKAGGVLIIAAVAFELAPPSIATISLLAAIPMTLAILAISAFGIETRQRPLEQMP
jgi:putative MFS transporter